MKMAVEMPVEDLKNGLLAPLPVGLQQLSKLQQAPRPFIKRAIALRSG
jgi:hypothetical protein